MHIYTHLKPESEGKTGLGIYPDGMVEHDGHVGQILDKLKELGLDDNTIVMYSTDNGAEVFTWPDGGTTPFRGEKNENWEGGYRVPCAIRWPGVIKPGTINNDLFSHEDMLPTLLAAAGVPDVKEQLLKGMKVGNKTFKVHLDGYNLTDRARRQGRRARARSSSTGTTTARWSGCATTTGRSSSRSSAAQGFDVWQDPFMPLRLPEDLQPALRSVRERPTRSRIGLRQWRIDRAFLLVPAQEYVGAVHRHVQGLPAEPEGRQLLARSGAGKAHGGEHQREVRGTTDWHRTHSTAGSRSRLPAGTWRQPSRSSTNGIRIRGRSTISTTIDGAGRTRTDGGPTSTSSGRTSPTRTTARSWSPAAEHRRRRSTPRAVPRRGSSASTSARRACGTRRLSSASTSLDQSRSPSVADRSRRRPGDDVRRDRVHGRPAPSRGSRAGAPGPARRARTRTARCI